MVKHTDRSIQRQERQYLSVQLPLCLSHGAECLTVLHLLTPAHTQHPTRAWLECSSFPAVWKNLCSSQGPAWAHPGMPSTLEAKGNSCKWCKPGEKTGMALWINSHSPLLYLGSQFVFRKLGWMRSTAHFTATLSCLSNLARKGFSALIW